MVQNVKKMAVYKVESPFDRRISSLVWHPKLITTLAAGSKGGDIILWNHKHETHDIFVKGVFSLFCSENNFFRSNSLIVF